LTVYRWLAGRKSRSLERANLEREGGITMGPLYDIVEGWFDMMQDYGFSAAFGVRWQLDVAPGEESRINIELCCSSDSRKLEYAGYAGFRSRADGVGYHELLWKPDEWAAASPSSHA
jgi:hypothetical protein